MTGYVFVPLGAGGTNVVPFNASVTAGSNRWDPKATTIPGCLSQWLGAFGCRGYRHVATGVYVGETLAGTSGTTGGLRVFNYSSLTSDAHAGDGFADCERRVAPNAILPAASGSYV